MLFQINGKNYHVNDNEYPKIPHKAYNNLKLFGNIALHERIVGLIDKIAEGYKNPPDEFNLLMKNINIIMYDIQHGGFIPINITESNNYKSLTIEKSIYLLNTKAEHINNIKQNLDNHKVNKNNLYFEPCNQDLSQAKINIILANNLSDTEMYSHLENTIIISKYSTYDSISILQSRLKGQIYLLENSDYFLCVGRLLLDKFNQTFKYYIDDSYIGSPSDSSKNMTKQLHRLLKFDNLINLCIMVKNGGSQFEEMLKKNLHVIDKWTILDTGSTDETLDIINRVLVGKKDGTLYQEPFINFRESRNRLLDLAGLDCKYNLMLDDTYVVEGDLRGFLNEIRSDQYAASYSLYIQSDDVKYGSNRITKSQNGLRYIHRIHEVITDKNNINVFVPEDIATIDDKRFEYMEKRTMDRKQLDLKFLFEEVADDPNDPRAYYYLGQTYNLLEDYQQAFFYFMKRCEFTNSGFIQERVDAAFEAARIANFKLNKPWSECEALYEKAFKIDESRPEPQYFIGIHYYLENNIQKAYPYFKRAFEIGFPIHCQYGLKPTLSFHFLPKFLAKICYNPDIMDYKLGLEATNLFLNSCKGKTDKLIKDVDDCYEEMVGWNKIYKNLMKYTGSRKPVNVNASLSVSSLPILCFVYDTNIECFNNNNNYKCINELAALIHRSGKFDVHVFSNMSKDAVIKEQINTPFITFKDLDSYCEFISTTYVHTSIICDVSEYLPVTFRGYSENVYLLLTQSAPTCNIIPIDRKMNKILFLNEADMKIFHSIFPCFKDITVPLVMATSSNSWEKDEINNFLNNIILPHKYEYKNILNWSFDSPIGSQEYYSQVLKYFNENYCTKKKNNQNIRILEIGSYTGMTLINILLNIPGSTGVGIDKWSNYTDEMGKTVYVEELKVFESATNNVKKAGLENRIMFMKGDSHKILENQLVSSNRNLYDFIHIDGSHLPFDYYNDLILSRNLLAKGGIMALNNSVLFNKNKQMESPIEAIKHFLHLYQKDYKVLFSGRHIFIESTF
jgi:predicted O-methyltransferase YrrM/TPR repeat protein